MDDHTRQPRRWLPWAVAAGVIALTMGIAATAMLSREPTPPGLGIDAQVVRDGDRVAAIGSLIQAPGQPVRLCRGNPMTQPNPAPAPTCSSWAFDVAESAIPDSVVWKQTDGVRHAEGSYRLSGVWRGGQIEEQSLALVPPAPQPTGYDKWYPGGRFELPCDVPSTWPDEGFGSPRYPEAQDRISAEVRRHPERYSGLWVAYPKEASMIGPDFGPYVVSVGTVGDPVAEQRRLSELFPYSLCVHKVDYSAQELNAVSRRLDLEYPGHTHVAPDLGRLEVEVFVLDEAMRTKIGDDADMVDLATFVHKERSSPGTA